MRQHTPKWIAACVGMLLTVSCIGGLSASATTVDDVIAQPTQSVCRMKPFSSASISTAADSIHRNSAMLPLQNLMPGRLTAMQP